MQIDITNRSQLSSLLSKLFETTEPLWGNMKAQNMIEHLSNVLQYTNGKKQIAQRTTVEEGLKAKQAFIYSDAAMATGLKSPLVPVEGPIPFEFSNLEEAKRHLIQELDDFESYHASHPDARIRSAAVGKAQL
jgi:hypothetical protein